MLLKGSASNDVFLFFFKGIFRRCPNGKPMTRELMIKEALQKVCPGRNKGTVQSAGESMLGLETLGCSSLIVKGYPNHLIWSGTFLPQIPQVRVT